LGKTNKKSEFKGISKRAKTLLSMEEGYDVEFKESAGGLDNSDIVAFANSETGGAILIGIKETKTGTGKQKGEVKGCPVGDGEKRKIVDKAESCVPPVAVEIFLENSEKKPFYRVEIPPGEEKPYCTASGIYKIRGDGRTLALLPGRLLTMFMERESGEFVERFREATIGLEESLQNTKEKLIVEMNELLDFINTMSSNIGRELEGIFYTAQSAEASSEEAVSFGDETLAAVGGLYTVLEHLEHSCFDTETHDNVLALLNHFGIEEPRIKEMRAAVKKFIREEHEKQKPKKKQYLLEDLNRIFLRATQKQIESWYKETIEELEGE